MELGALGVGAEVGIAEVGLDDVAEAIEAEGGEAGVVVGAGELGAGVEADGGEGAAGVVGWGGAADGGVIGVADADARGEAAGAGEGGGDEDFVVGVEAGELGFEEASTEYLVR